MNASSDGFLPDNYEAPSTGGYTTLKAGMNKFRVLSSALLMWTIWEDKKVKRLKYDKENVPKVADKEANSVKHTWGLIVYNYDTKAIEILELASVNVQNAATTYARNPAWGSPVKYDIYIEKTGSGKENTKYALTVDPPTPVSDEIKQAYEATPIDLNQLLVDNGNPFLASAGTNASTAPAVAAAKIITPENWAPGDALPLGYKYQDHTNPAVGIMKDKPF